MLVHELCLVVFNGGLAMLIGPPGTGKTQMAAGLIKFWVMRGYGSAQYVRAIDLLAQVRNEYGDDGPKQGTALKQMAGQGLLVIDEMSATKTSAHAFETLQALLDKRYGLKMPTVLISNDEPAEAYERLGAPVMSRLMETGGIIVFGGEDYRARAAQSAGGDK